MADPHKERWIRIGRGVLLAVTAGVALSNGMHFSPYFDPVLFFVQRLMPRFLNPMLVFYGNSLLIALAVLLIAGVPAAIYERLAGLRQSSMLSLGIWLVATLVLSAPSLMGAAGMD